MKDNHLVIDTNPYLKDPEVFAAALCRNVKSSSAIEGIELNVEAKKKDGKYTFTTIVE